MEEQIRLAIELAKEGTELHNLPPVNDQELGDLICGLIESDQGFFSLKGESVFIGVLCPCLYNSEFLIAQELLWHSRTPSMNGVRVWREFEQWAKSMNASQIHIPSMSTSPDSIQKLFKKNGYTMENIVMRKDI